MRPTREGWKVLRNALSTLDVLADGFGFDIEWEIKPKSEGTNTMEIEVREGETLVEAIKRQAKEQTAAEPKNTIEKMVQNSEIGLKKIEKVTKVPSKSPSKKSVPASALGGDPSEGKSDPQAPQIYSAIHVYQREGETDGKTRWNANHEREMHGPNTLVFCHLHSFGGKCDSSCTVKIEQED